MVLRSSQVLLRGRLTGFSQEPIGTGPFMLTEWVRGDRIVLDRNPNYWRKGYPKLDRIIFRPITESSTRAAAIQTARSTS